MIVKGFKERIRDYFLFFALLLVVLFLSFSLVFPHIDVSFGQDRACEFSNWYYFTEASEQVPFQYGLYIKSVTDNPREYTIYNKLPENFKKNSYIFIRAATEECYAYVGDKLVYQMHAMDTNPTFQRLTGIMWHMIPIPDGSDGEIVKVRIISDFNNSNSITNKIYLDPIQNIVKTIMTINMPFVIIYIIMIIMGILLILFGILGQIVLSFKKMQFIKIKMQTVTPGFILLFFGMWLLFQNPGIFSVISNPYFRLNIVIFSLVSLIYSFMFYIRSVFTDKKNIFIVSVIIRVYEFYYITMYVLKILGVSDFGFMISGIHVIVVIFLLVSFYLAFLEKKHYKNISAGRLFSSLMIALVSVIIEIFIYNFVRRDVGVFSIIGLVVVCVFLITNSASDLAKAVKTSKQLDYFRNLSTTDSMTKFKNRLAYSERISEIKRNATQDFTVIVCDLKSLKYINDIYGHAEGDRFIISVSEILRDVFKDCADMYRIGGDEFVIIVKSIDRLFIEDKIILVNAICAQKERNLNYNFRIGIGYAIFNKDLDYIDDIVAKADSNMYIDKSRKSYPTNSLKINTI